MLIINADDFGKDPPVNRGILEAFRQGICSSTTLMPNQPGFEEVCQMIHDHGLVHHVGIHLVLRGGLPLTEGIRRFSRLCDSSGQLCLSRVDPTKPILNLPLSERKALAEEIRAQVHRCRSRGIPLTHLDSHYHLHNEWAVAQVVFSLVKELKIPYVRIARNCGKDLRWDKRLYKFLFNQRIRAKGLQRTQYFGGISDYLEWKCRQRRLDLSKLPPFEIMVHPVWEEHSQSIMDAIDRVPLKQAIQQVDFYQEAVSFDESKYG